jgi:tetrahydromethanopterin S-methyltransferase subunit B
MSARPWVVAFVALVAAACASKSGVSRTDDLMNALDNLNKSSVTARADIDKVAGTLKTIEKGGIKDPRGLFAQFQAEVGKVAGSKAAVESGGASVRSAMDAHFAAWEKDANEMQNAEIRAASMKRRDEARKTMSSLEPSISKAKTVYDGYVATLNDIEKFLAADLSPGGVSAAEDSIEKATDDGENVQEALEKLEELVTETRNAMAVPATPPAETPPANK